MNNMKTYLSHARLKNFVILKYILLTGYNDSAKEVEMWLKNCKDMGIVEVQFDSEHSVSASENCENKKYTNRTIKMLKFAEITAKKYNIKVTSFLAFMNRAHRIYEKQMVFYNENKEKFTDLFLNGNEIDSDKYYKDLHINIDKDFSRLNNIDNLIKEEKFAPSRIAFLTSDYKEITKSPNFENTAKTLLRLGFDLNFETKKYNTIIEEIIKTSYSEVKLTGFHFPWLINKNEILGRIV